MPPGVKEAPGAVESEEPMESESRRSSSNGSAPPREAARLEALARVAGAAALGGGVHGVPAAIAEGVEEAFGPVAVLNVYEPETDRYVVRAVAGEASELMGTSSAS